MNIIDALRLVRKHIVLLLFTPIILVALVVILTQKPAFKYSSETTLYTGIASGSSIEMEKSFNFFANNTAFDNLINVIKSRETQHEVAIRLLAQHLMLPQADPHYISNNSFDDLRKITPKNVLSLVVKSTGPTLSSDIESHSLTQKKNEQQFKFAQDSIISDNSEDTTKFSFSKLDTTSTNVITLPASINREAFEQTVKNLKAYMTSSDTNFVYKLLYFENPHYSVSAISSVNAQRIGSSDLVKLKYDSDDPGICQQTLALLTEVCIQNYKFTKENRSDAVVRYFEYQLKRAANKLRIGEDKLLKFNEENNIINYYEQSKAIANVKENLDIEYNEKQIKLAGTKASIKRIEDKLGTQQQVQLINGAILENRNRLTLISSRISTIEIIANTKTEINEELVKLKIEAETIKDELRKSINDLYRFTNSTEGLPISKLLNDWINNVISYEETKAGIEVLSARIKEFQKQYAIYAPAGANLKRIEREISVSEHEFLEILHGLNLAKLKVQDAELSSAIKVTDLPFFPLSPNPTKRKILFIAAGLVGFMIIMFIIIILEYLDNTLNNQEKASKKIQLKTIGIFPKVFLKIGTINFPFLANRLLEVIIQQIDLLTQRNSEQKEPRILLIVSSLENEGKTVTAGNIALKLKKQGIKALLLNYTRDSLLSSEANQIGYITTSLAPDKTGHGSSRSPFRFISTLMGYPDNRINPSSPFLQKPKSYLESNYYYEFEANGDYFSSSSYHDLVEKDRFLIEKPDYVIIELPSLLNYSYPSKLVASADLTIIVCRSNRVWSPADQSALDIFKRITKQDPVVLLNGVELQVIESVLGDLPKKRSWIRRVLKNVVRFQFKSNDQV